VRGPLVDDVGGYLLDVRALCVCLCMCERERESEGEMCVLIANNGTFFLKR